MSEAKLITDQREVAFNDQTITVVQTEDGSTYLPIRPMCDNLGLDRRGQQQRIDRDPVLSEVVVSVKMKTKTRGEVDVTAIPLDYLNGWLFGINANRVKDEIRSRLIRYQKDCYKVLADAFGRNKVTARPLGPDVEELLQHSDDPTAVAFRHAMAIANLAREQMLFKVQVEGRIDSAEARIDAIEAELGNPDRLITQSQQMQISQAVKAVAYELGNRTGGNEFGGVWGELYRRFEVSSYKQLPGAKHAEAMNFLSDWYSQLTGAELPF